VPVPILEKGLHLLSTSNNQKDLQEALRLTFTNPHVTPRQLGLVGTLAWVKSAYQLHQHINFKRTFFTSKDKKEIYPDLLTLPGEVVLLVLRGLLRGGKTRYTDKEREWVVRTVLETLAKYEGSGPEERLAVFRGVIGDFTRAGDIKRFYDVAKDAGLDTDEELIVGVLNHVHLGASVGEQDGKYDELRRNLETRKKEGTLGVKGWNWHIRERIRVGQVEGPSGNAAIEETVKDMRQAGISPNQETFELLLFSKLDHDAETSTTSIQSLPDGYIDKVWETTALLGLDPEDQTWERAFEKVIRTVDRTEGLGEEERRELVYTAYENAVRAGARVSIPLARQVVDRLKDPSTSAQSKTASTPDYTRINNVRSDLGAAMDESDEILRGGLLTMVDRDEALRSIYAVCLEGAVVGNNAVPDAISLLDEMRRRHVVLGQTTAMRLTFDLMDRAQTHHDAFRAYSYVRALDPMIMDEQDYLDIILHFIRLVLPKSPSPLPKLTFEFLRDMRDAAIPPQARVYTMMVNEYTRYLRRRRKERATGSGESTGSDEKIAGNTIQTIQKIHSIVKLDSFLDVDLPLLIALMDAYNQLQLWPETFELWNEIVARHRMERESSADGRQTSLQRVAYRPALSVILDACGYSGNLARARKIWEWAHGRDMIRCSYGNWKSWIECLCRCGRLTEACDVVRGPFKRSWSDGMLGPDERTTLLSRVDQDELPVLEMLVKFSWRSKSEWIEVRKMIESEFPEQWEVLKRKGKVKGRELASQQSGA